jgi:TetR/AcrR family transcriptional repressor of bet genes
LLLALERLVSRHLARLDARLAEASGDARAQVHAFIDFHLGLGADQDPDALACWILLSGEALREAKVRAALEHALAEMAQRLERVLADGVATRALRCERVDAAASALLATIQGYFVLAATARSLIPKGSAAACTKQMADGLLCFQPGAGARRGQA